MSNNNDKTVLSAYMSQELVDRIDAIADRLSKKMSQDSHTHVRLSRSAMAATLLARGLEAYEQEISARPTD